MVDKDKNSTNQPVLLKTQFIKCIFHPVMLSVSYLIQDFHIISIPLKNLNKLYNKFESNKLKQNKTKKNKNNTDVTNMIEIKAGVCKLIFHFFLSLSLLKCVRRFNKPKKNSGNVFMAQALMG